ncbi:MAG TPA: enolase C-terminal domain-like protein [Solirubrobacteraceae bacterium]
MSVTAASGCHIERLDVTAYKIPTDAPESDGTMEWDATTIVVVEAQAGGHAGLGWTYGPAAIAGLVDGMLAGAVHERDPLDIAGAWAAMVGAVRNAGPWGLAMYAVAAVDVALWDLKARLLDVPLCGLLGRRREAVEIYGSGGFTSYSDEQLRDQLGGWAKQGMSRVKLKVGRDHAADPHRVAVAREAVGPDVELMVDANGAWSPERALAMAHRFAEHDVRWLEEPVSSDDLAGLRRVRAGAPPGMAIAAGEYATDAYGFARLVDAVDVLQADVTRCGGITGFVQADALCAAHNTDLSAHCAPNLAVHPMAAAQRGRHIEYFHDHDRIERLLFDGVLDPRDGALTPDTQRPGLGLEFKRADAARYAT